MSDKKHWIVKIVPALAFSAGIIMSSIGAIMLLSSSAKLALFEHEPYGYVSSDQCRFDYNKPVVDGVTYERTEDEVKKCLEERKREELLRFQANEKRDIVDGGSILIVGSILLLAFRRRK